MYLRENGECMRAVGGVFVCVKCARVKELEVMIDQLNESESGTDGSDDSDDESDVSEVSDVVMQGAAVGHADGVVLGADMSVDASVVVDGGDVGHADGVVLGADMSDDACMVVDGGDVVHADEVVLGADMSDDAAVVVDGVPSDECVNVVEDVSVNGGDRTGVSRDVRGNSVEGLEGGSVGSQGVELGSKAGGSQLRYRRALVVGDSVVRGVENIFCGGDRKGRAVACFPGAKIEDIEERIAGMTRDRADGLGSGLVVM